MENFGLTAARSGANRVGQTETKSRNCLGQTETKVNSVFVRKRYKIELCPKIVPEGQNRDKVGKMSGQTKLYILRIYKPVPVPGSVGEVVVRS